MGLASTGIAADLWPGTRVLIASVFLGLAVGMFLLLRRAAGGITSPLPPLPLVATALGLIAWALGIHLLWPRDEKSPSRSVVGELRSPDSLFTLWLPALTIVLFAVACSYPGKRLVDWLVWVPAIAAIGARWPMKRPARRSSPAALQDENAGQVLQQLTRIRLADCREALHGTLIAEFAAGERSASLFVAFCPPFETLPTVDARVDDASSATVKVAQRLHNGVQLDVRLSETPEDSLTVSVELFAAEPESTQEPRPPRAI
ncbi:MAG: hypothetical protein WD738_05240 [Pirellulales bacterium]